ncbi:MAG: hypothetical protein R2695_18035 [Acidimicrobiales bacterium]
MLRRLHQTARPDDAEADEAYRSMVGDDLLRSRLESLEVIEQGLGGVTLDGAAVAAWMRGSTISGSCCRSGWLSTASISTPTTSRTNPTMPRRCWTSGRGASWRCWSPRPRTPSTDTTPVT